MSSLRSRQPTHTIQASSQDMHARIRHIICHICFKLYHCFSARLRTSIDIMHHRHYTGVKELRGCVNHSPTSWLVPVETARFGVLDMPERILQATLTVNCFAIVQISGLGNSGGLKFIRTRQSGLNQCAEVCEKVILAICCYNLRMCDFLPQISVHHFLTLCTHNRVMPTSQPYSK